MLQFKVHTFSKQANKTTAIYTKKLQAIYSFISESNDMAWSRVGLYVFRGIGEDKDLVILYYMLVHDDLSCVRFIGNSRCTFLGCDGEQPVFDAPPCHRLTTSAYQSSIKWTSGVQLMLQKERMGFIFIMLCP